MSGNDSNIPAGWYDDPSSPTMLRWWDGTNWAEQTMPKQPPQPAAPVFNAPGAYNAQTTNSFNSMASFAGEKPTNFLWQSIVATLLCCLPLGLVGVYFAAKVDTAWMSGQHEAAQEAARKAKLFTLISLGVGVAVALVWVVALVLGASAAETAY